MFMENNKDLGSWSPAPIYQSQWLQTTLSDLDEKMGAMMTILDAANSPNQGHREDLIRMLQDFGQSYRVLAISYSQLKSKTSHDTLHSGSLSSTTPKTISSTYNRRASDNLEHKKLEAGCNCQVKSLIAQSNIRYDGTNQDFEQVNTQEDEYDDLLSSDPCNMKFELELERCDTQTKDKITNFATNENIIMQTEGLELKQRIEDSSIANFRFDSMWSMLKYQMTKLTEDNVHHLVELVQRNDEKRETIRRLQSEVEILMHENKAIQISLRHSNANSECNESKISTPGPMSMSKLFRGCSS